MHTLIIKLGASGDVVRTSPLLRALGGDVDWLTSDRNAVLLAGIGAATVVPWSDRDLLHGRHYDLVINLEDDRETAALLDDIEFDELYGAFSVPGGRLVYTDSASEWFDLGLISRHGIREANRLKLANRESYQHLLFRGLGLRFSGEQPLLPRTKPSPLSGHVAIAPEAGAVWPMKQWAYYDELAARLRADGLTVNMLPQRETMLEHLADVRGHRMIVCGDSLPMHLALGSGISCVGLFICTSPWEIHDYGLLTKIVSPDLARYFYRRDVDPGAARSISLEEVRREVLGAFAPHAALQEAS